MRVTDRHTGGGEMERQTTPHSKAPINQAYVQGTSSVLKQKGLVSHAGTRMEGTGLSGQTDANHKAN